MPTAQQRTSRRPSAPEANLLWAASGNQCAAPDCKRPLIHHHGTTWTTLGQLAHIRAHSLGGPRYDPAWVGRSESYENFVVLCGEHHAIVDSDPETYTVEMLTRWKADHEATFTTRIGDTSVLLGLAEPPPPARLHVTRERHLDDLSGAFSVNRAVTLTGMGGGGKTQLARTWFTTRQADYTFRWWVRGHDRDTLLNDLASLAPLLGVPQPAGVSIGTTAAAVREQLSALDGWLLVIDNAQGPDHIGEPHPQRHGQGPGDQPEPGVGSRDRRSSGGGTQRS